MAEDANRLHQMTMSYVAAEDRILFRLSTTSESEYRMWFTRRFVRILWGALIQVLERHPTIRDDMSKNVKEAVLGMQHQEAVQQSDFQQPDDFVGFHLVVLGVHRTARVAETLVVAVHAIEVTPVGQ